MDVVICGGGVIGMAAAMMLARDGHEVTVLERDGGPVPASATEAWERWDRVGVPQFRQPHNLFPRFRLILEDELPDVLQGLLDAGGTWVGLLDALPPFITDRDPRPDDDKFRFVTGRRPMVEYVHARAAENERGVTVRRGVKVEGLTVSSEGARIPHITGVRTDRGVIRSDIVVDAMGRRSPAGEWIQAAGGRAPTVTSQDSGFTYYTRYFTGPERPRQIGGAVAMLGTFLILTLPGDNDTWSVTLWAPSGDRPLKEFRNVDKFTKVVHACPFHSQWLEGEPISDVLAMAGILDRYRRFVVDDNPVATGLAAVGDAWACTNPSAGRGLSVGLLHAQRLRDTLRCFHDPVSFALEWDRVTETDLAPYYWNQLAADHARLDAMAALREGRAVDGRVPFFLPPEYADAARAMLYDPDVFRAVLETLGCLALPQEVFARPGIWDKVQATAGEPMSLPGPTREELLALLA
jgi:2-polyprenyl-6-methoxyphenol hydroxylase-like FAD-dependent oxidoreductase